MAEAGTVVCGGCGRRAVEELDDTQLTAGDDTWWVLYPPFPVACSELYPVLDPDSPFRSENHACSPGCVRTVLERMRPAYESVEEDLLNNPNHFAGPG